MQNSKKITCDKCFLYTLWHPVTEGWWFCGTAVTPTDYVTEIRMMNITAVGIRSETFAISEPPSCDRPDFIQYSFTIRMLMPSACTDEVYACKRNYWFLLLVVWSRFINQSWQSLCWSDVCHCYEASRVARNSLLGVGVYIFAAKCGRQHLVANNKHLLHAPCTNVKKHPLHSNFQTRHRVSYSIKYTIISVVVKTFLKNLRPRPRPWYPGLETKTETLGPWSRDQDQDLRTKQHYKISLQM